MHLSTFALTRRELLAGGLAFAARSALAGGQFGGVTPTPPPPDSRYPLPPTWETELKEIAPGVYAYIQAGGPGRDNASVANAGIVVGDDAGPASRHPPSRDTPSASRSRRRTVPH
jgi:hypothetical protein